MIRSQYSTCLQKTLRPRYGVKCEEIEDAVDLPNNQPTSAPTAALPITVAYCSAFNIEDRNKFKDKRPSDREFERSSRTQFAVLGNGH